MEIPQSSQMVSGISPGPGKNDTLGDTGMKVPASVMSFGSAGGG
jgi:hypothetical protein